MLIVKNSYQQKLLKQVGYFIDEFLNDEEIQFCKQIFQSNFISEEYFFCFSGLIVNRPQKFTFQFHPTPTHI